jgi:hypothetical protein
MRIAAWFAVALACTVLLAAGCKQRSSAQMYDRIAGSDFGLKLHLGMSAAEVEELFGKAQAKQELQGGKVVELYFLPPGATGTDRETPQFTCTFLDNRLIKIYNRFFPEDNTKPQPKIFAEILPKVKLGCRPSDLVTILGKPSNDGVQTEWQFTGGDKEMITILARYVDVEGVSEKMCCMLQVTKSPVMGELKGEEADKASALQRSIREQVERKDTK